MFLPGDPLTGELFRDENGDDRSKENVKKSELVEFSWVHSIEHEVVLRELMYSDFCFRDSVEPRDPSLLITGFEISLRDSLESLNGREISLSDSKERTAFFTVSVLPLNALCIS